MVACYFYVLKKYLVLAYVLQNKPRSSDDMASELTNNIVLAMIAHQYKIRKIIWKKSFSTCDM